MRAAESFDLRGRARACVALADVLDKDVLDVGCSFGWFCRVALERGARSVVGADIEEETLDVARTYEPRASFIRASALDIPLESDGFDMITMFDVIEHVPMGTEVQAFQEAGRLLRPGGTLALSTPARSAFATYTDPAFYLGHRHYHVSEMLDLLGQAGFQALHVSTGGGVFDQLDLLVYYCSRHLARRERHPLEFIRKRADREWQRGRGANTILVIARPR